MEMEYFTPEEVERLINAADEEIKPIFAGLAYTGMRTGELALKHKKYGLDPLRWRNVILDGPKSYIQVRKGKGGKDRIVPIDPKLLPYLQDLRKKHEGIHRSSGLQIDDLYVFGANDGRKPRHDLRRAYWRAQRNAGLKKVSPLHALRHSFSYMFLKTGGSLEILSKILGHHSPSFTMKVYGHFKPDDLIAEMNRVSLAREELIAGSSQSQSDLDIAVAQISGPNQFLKEDSSDASIR